MFGAVIALGSLFAFLLLFAIDSLARFNNPYLGVLTYLVAPGFLILGLLLFFLGAFIEHSRKVKRTPLAIRLQFDFSRPRDRKLLIYFSLGSVGFLLLTAMGSYYTYHFTESTQFCGNLSHTVMEPEMTTYQHSPHARVNCVACHIGPGATWFVRSKLSGTYQVYAVLARKYPRPIPTPVKNLRPAPETCEKCHWPREFVGNVDRMFNYYLGDETNTYYGARMLLKVGGADPSRGPVGGIHWHMNIANRVEYIAADAERQKIPWVRLIDSQEVVTEYRAPKFTNDVSQYQVHVMDCMDCHNRPSHIFSSPERAVNLAISLGRIDRNLPWIKTNALFLLTQPYTNVSEGLIAIKNLMAARYPTNLATGSIAALQQIYTNNFFPTMAANWRAYPNNIGHMEWPGCSRCHDDNHATSGKKKKIQFSDCSMCHIILAQGNAAQLEQLNAHGQKFAHPGGDLGADATCHECHTGGP
jgi:hypothetical protein